MIISTKKFVFAFLLLAFVQFAKAQIELGSHTDSRGNDMYNLKLAQGRANAAVNYIVSKGIAKERITAKGYGETRLINKCANGIKCNDEEHQLNRRTEFKIVKQ